MATMNISLPYPMRDWVQNQIQDGKYSSSSDYVRDLIRRAQEVRQQQQALQAAITEGTTIELNFKETLNKSFF